MADTSSRPREHPRLSAAVSGLGLAAQIALAAVDGVPIAKQVLGVSSRIITLAEDIEKRRDALYELAETARVMGENIKAVVSDRKFSGEIVQSLDPLLGVLRSIRDLLEKHKAKTGFRKALGYAFTTAKNVDALNQELSRAAQQFQLVAALDNNARLQETNARLQETNGHVQEINIRIQEDAQYFGEFRHIRHSDVESMKLIAENDVWFTRYKSRIFSAKVNGSVCILRCFAQRAGGKGECESDSWLRQQVIQHDQLLEELSRVQNLHPNIARLYGRSSKEHFDRFNVMNSGYVPAIGVKQKAETPDWGWNIIEQIVDALCHLKDCGASWEPEMENPVFLDGNGAPIIGLHNDLRSFDTRWHLWQLKALGEILEHGLKRSWKNSYPNEEHTLAIRSGAVRSPKPYSQSRCFIPRRFIRPLSEKGSAYIATAMASCNDPFDIWGETGTVVLRAAASGRKVGSAFYTRYFAASDHSGDSISMYRVDESDDELVHLTTRVDVPASMTKEFRTKLGITPPRAGDSYWFYSTRDPAEPGSMSFRPRFPWLYQ